MSVFSARAPERRARAPSRTLLPAPVSPVTAMKPFENSSSVSGRRAKFLIFRNCSMVES